MADKTDKEMLQGLYQAVIGIPENPDENGMIGDIAEIKRDIKYQNGRQRKTDRRLNVLIGVLIGVGFIVGGTAGIFQLLGE